MKPTSTPSPAIDPVLPLTPAEQAVVDQINAAIAADPSKKATYLDQLRSLLETAISVELATIPIYLFTYYSIERLPTSNQSPLAPPGKPGTGESPSIPDSVDATRAEQLQIFANRAGATIMSVAVEEMLHMSLSSNILYAFGGTPELYRRSPGPPNGPHYPVDLPGHAKLGPNHKPMLIPLAPLSFVQLWKFLEIEWPEDPGAIPQDQNFATIGQVYAYVRCLICSNATNDFPFQDTARQLQPDFYSSNNIDTAYATMTFDKSKPAPRPGGGDGGCFGYPPTAKAAKLEDSSDSHAGMTALLTIDSIEKAQQAIATICDQGEGYNPKHIDRTDDPTADEDSHFYKFLCLQSCLQKPMGWKEPSSGLTPRDPGMPLITPAELDYFVAPFPKNPVTRADSNVETPAYTDLVHQAISDALNGLYQYMLILTETAFKVTGKQQKALFYQGMHMSMIWIMDKLIQQMRTIPLGGGGVLAPTFENIDLGPRSAAYASLIGLQNNACQLIDEWQKAHGSTIYNDLKGYIQMFATLPDVTPYWGAPEVIPDFTPVTPPFPPLHACMGLNACKNLGRPDMPNACAGQGYCATSVQHTCHVKNECAGQGGCGLYGTAAEQGNPGGNDCKGYGSCATPINAERFSTVGDNVGKSVWARARRRFEERWPAVRQKILPHNPDAPEQLAPAPEPFTETGPSYAWVAQNGCMTACGASGLSGAGRCS